MVSDVAMLGTVIVSALGAMFGLYQARKADKSATTTKTIEIGVKDLVDQYQESNQELREEVKKQKQDYSELESSYQTLKIEVRELKTKVDRLETEIDDKDALIISLKNRLGEPLE